MPRRPHTLSENQAKTLSPRLVSKVSESPAFITPGPPHGFARTASGLDHPQLDRMVKFDDPQEKRVAVNNLVGVSDRGTKAEHEAGRVWYPKVHDATVKGVKKHGLDSVLHGAGVVGAVSPQMDFSGSNIHAFDEMAKLKSNPAHMAVLHRSAVNVVPHPTIPGRATQRRTAEASAMINQHYPSLAKAPDANIMKASRIWEGEHPDEVLNPRTALKTNTFTHNIADPSRTTSPHTGHPLATIDGRSRDIASNQMLTWTTDRGIGSGVLKPKKTGERPMSRGEHFADAHGQAAKVLSGEESRDITPGEVQARTWVIAKRIEGEMPGAKKSRQRPGEIFSGPPRKGQRYLP